MSISHFDILNFYYQNVRSLRSKLSSFYLNVSDNFYDIILLTETWLNDSIADNEIFPPSYRIFRSDRKYDTLKVSRGGGVLIAVNSSIRAVKLDLSNLNLTSLPSIDLIGIKLYFQKCILQLLLLYIPPALSTNEYSLLFETLCQCNYLYDSNVFIVGDFNLPAYSSCINSMDLPPSVKHLSDFLTFLSLHQCNNITNNLNRILDLVISNECITISKANDPLVNEDLHHPSLNWTHNLHISKSPKELSPDTIFYFNFHKANFQELYSELLLSDWNFLLRYHDANSACQAFYEFLFSILERFVPKTKPRSLKYPVWFSAKIIKLIKKKDSLWKKFKKSGLLSDREEFTQYRKLVKKEIRVAYGNFVAEAESNIKSDPKEFWKFVKLKKGNSGVPCNMTYLNKTVSGGNQIVHSFANYFKSTFQPSNIFGPVNNRDSMSYNNFSVTEISEDEVFLKIKNLKSNNTAGPDSIPAFLIKDCVGIFSKPLTYLYNIILSTQTFPDHWKVSKIIPLFKKDDKSVIENYRPISLLNNFAKIFESLLHDTIYYQIKHHLSDAQHGFVQGRSTVTNLMTISQDLASNLDNGYQTDVVYTDFSKAFDRLDHAILLRKLLEFGFSEKLYLLFTSYITERKCFVECCGFRSSNFTATSGVPQGSVLGPLIFNIFINDVVNDIRSSVLLYADDMKLYRRITSIQDCLVLQSDLDKVHSWCSKNLLQLNYKKCYLLSFTLLRVLIVFDYTLNNNIILRQSQVKDLGVIFDKNLSFTNHVNTIISEALKMFGFIVRNCTDLKSETPVKLLYYSLVRSKLEYAAIVWYPHYSTYVMEIERVQRRFLKYLNFKMFHIYPQRRFPQEELLRKFSMLSIADRINTAYVRFFVKLLNNYISCPYLLNLFNFSCSTVMVRRRNILYNSRARTNLMKYSPINNICNAVNNFHYIYDIFTCKQTDITNFASRRHLQHNT